MDTIEMQSREMADFRKILENYFPCKEDMNIKSIINICCGPVTEEPVLYEYFRPSRLVSIDNCIYRKEDAENYGRNSFVYGDLRELENILSRNDRFDMIIGRNVPLSPYGEGTYPNDPNSCFKGTSYLPVEKGDEWLSIFGRLRCFCNDDASIFLTFLRTDELLRGAEILEKTDYKIIKKEKNKFLCFSDRIGVAHETKDHYVIIGKVKSALLG